jgi:polysaccharide chain length determinant protein (PEP-CTERM system associated)
VLPGKKYTPEEILRILARRWWLIPPPLVLGMVLGVYMYSRVPEMYRSETLITIVPQRIPDEYVRPTVPTNIEDRLPAIREQILSRSRLERIILDFNLYPSKRASGPMEDVVEQMRDRHVTIGLEGKESFRVSFVNGNAKTAQQVTAKLASVTIEEHMRDRENLAENTYQFLESQLQDAKRRLVEHESKLELYSRQHAGELPSQLQVNLQAIQTAQTQLQSLTESTNQARQRRLEIERQLNEAQTAPIAVAIPGAGPAAQAAPSSAQQLETAQANLDLFRQRYTPDHPDIRALERSIKELQAKVAEEAQRPASATAKPLSPAEALRQQRIRDLQGQIEIVDRQIAQNGVEDTRLRQTIAGYQAKVDKLPTRQSELVELTRDYSALQETYAALLKKKEDSQLAANLQRRQVGEQFRIIDPASLPERPYNQAERQGALLGGVMGGLAIGLALIAFLEFRDSSFRREEDVLRVLTLPVLALVPLMMSEPERKFHTRRKRKIAFGVVAVLMVIGSAAAVAFWQLR